MNLLLFLKVTNKNQEKKKIDFQMFFFILDKGSYKRNNSQFIKKQNSKTWHLKHGIWPFRV